jgi:hypothetical protein
VVPLARTILLFGAGGKRPCRRVITIAEQWLLSTKVAADIVNVRGRLAVEVGLTDRVSKRVGFDLVHVKISTHRGAIDYSYSEGSDFRLQARVGERVLVRIISLITIPDEEDDTKDF